MAEENFSNMNEMSDIENLSEEQISALYSNIFESGVILADNKTPCHYDAYYGEYCC